MMNPVLRREMITSLRGWKNYAILSFYLIMLTIGVAIFFYSSINGSYNFTFDPQEVLYLYATLAMIQMALVAFSVPALTAGSISGERERQTLDLLLVTKLSPFSIVIGKLLSSMAFVLLLVISTLPIFSIVFYFGSLSVGSLLMVICFTLTTSYMIGGVSVFFSCIYKRTVVSIMLVYIFIGVLCFGTLIWVFLPMMVNGYDEASTLTMLLKLIPNPGAGFLSLIDSQVGFGIFQDLFYSTSQDTKNEILFWTTNNLWLLHIIFQLIVGSIFILLATGLLDPVRERKQNNKKTKNKADQQIKGEA